MSKAFLKNVGCELSSAAAAAKNEIKSEIGEVAKIFKDDETSDSPLESKGLVTRTNADDVCIAPPSNAGSSVLMSGPLKKRDGTIVKKWIDVHVELRENSLTCFGSADRMQIMDTLVIDAGIEFTITERDKLPALIFKKASGRGPAIMAKELVLGAESEGLRDRWAEIVDACCLKARTHVEARKMVQEEAASRARAEAELQRKALEDAARNRERLQRKALEDAEGGAATFSLEDLDDLASNPGAGAETHAQAQATPPARKPLLQPVTPADPPDGKKGGRLSMSSRMRSAFTFKGKDSKEEREDYPDEGREQLELEESTKDMMLAEANHQLRQAQEDLRLERHQAADLRDQIRQLLSEDKGAQEMLQQMEQAKDEARKAQELLQEARAAEIAALTELTSLRTAAATTATKRAEEAAARDAKLSQEAEEEEAMRRQVASLQQEVLRLQGEVATQQLQLAEQGQAASEVRALLDARDKELVDREKQLEVLKMEVETLTVQNGREQEAAAAVERPGAVVAGRELPASIAEFCKSVGLSKYTELMVENEIDLDVLPALGQEDWEEMGISEDDMPILLEAVEAFERGAGGASGGGEEGTKMHDEQLKLSGGEVKEHSQALHGKAQDMSKVLAAREADVQGRERNLKARELAVENWERDVSKREAAVDERERGMVTREAAEAQCKGGLEEWAKAVREKETLVEMEQKRVVMGQESVKELQELVRERERIVEEKEKGLQERERDLQVRAERVQGREDTVEEVLAKMKLNQEVMDAERIRSETEIEEAKRQVEEVKKEVEEAKLAVDGRELDVESRLASIVESEGVALMELSARMKLVEQELAQLVLQLTAAAAQLEQVRTSSEDGERAAATAFEALKRTAAAALEEMRTIHKHSTSHSSAELTMLQEQVEDLAAVAAAAFVQQDMTRGRKEGEAGAEDTLHTKRLAVAAVEGLRVQHKKIMAGLNEELVGVQHDLDNLSVSLQKENMLPVAEGIPGRLAHLQQSQEDQAAREVRALLDARDKELMDRERELNVLKMELETLAVQKQQQQEQLEAAEEAPENAAVAQAQAGEEDVSCVRKMEQEVAIARMQAEAAQRELEEVKATLTASRVEAEISQRERLNVEGMLAACNIEVQTAEKAAHEAEVRLSQAKEAISGEVQMLLERMDRDKRRIEEVVAAVRAESDVARTEKQEIEAQLAAVLKETEESKILAEEIRQRSAVEEERRLAATQQEREALEAELVKMEEQLLEREAEFRASESRVQQVEIAIRNKEQELRASEEREGETGEKLRVSEERLIATKIELSKLEESFNALEVRNQELDEALKEALVDKEARAKEWQARDGERALVRETARKELEVEQEKMASLREALAVEKMEWERVQEEEKKKGLELQEMLQECERREASVIALEEGVKEREQGLEARERGVQEREMDVEERKKALLIFERGVEEREARVGKREEGGGNQEQEVGEKEREMESQMAEREKGLGEREKAVVERERVVEERMRTLEEGKRGIKDREKKAQELNEALQDLQEGIIEREAIVQQKEEALGKHYQELKDRSADVQRREESLEDRESKVGCREGSLERRERTLKQMADHSVASLVHNNGNRTAVLKDKGLEEVQRCELLIEDMEIALETLSAEVDDLNQKLASAQKTERELQQKLTHQEEQFSRRHLLDQEYKADASARMQLLEEKLAVSLVDKDVGAQSRTHELEAQVKLLEVKLTAAAAAADERVLAENRAHELEAQMKLLEVKLAAAAADAGERVLAENSAHELEAQVKLLEAKLATAAADAAGERAFVQNRIHELEAAIEERGLALASLQILVAQLQEKNEELEGAASAGAQPAVAFMHKEHVGVTSGAGAPFVRAACAATSAAAMPSASFPALNSPAANHGGESGVEAETQSRPAAGNVPRIPVPSVPSPLIHQAEAGAPLLEADVRFRDSRPPNAQEMDLAEEEETRIAQVQALMMQEGWDS